MHLGPGGGGWSVLPGSGRQGSVSILSRGGVKAKVGWSWVFPFPQGSEANTLAG